MHVGLKAGNMAQFILVHPVMYEKKIEVQSVYYCRSNDMLVSVGLFTNLEKINEPNTNLSFDTFF